MTRKALPYNFTAMSDNLGVYTVAQTAETLGRPISTIHGWIQTGKLAATKTGEGRTSIYLIPAAEIERIRTEANG